MQDKQMLMIPGPTPVPETALLALAKHPIGHRTSEFSQMMGEVTQNLKWLYQTHNDVLMLTSSGTGAMEAAMINFLSPGDRILVGCNGKFGERWGEVGEIYGLNVEKITAEWGKSLNPELFAQKLQGDKQKQIKAVIITHNETSTGVINDLETISTYVREHGEALTIVDAVTSIGAVNVPTDEWSLDVVVSASQKGYMVPPGLGFVAVSSKAWEAYKTAKFPKYYLDLDRYRQAAQNNFTPFTPPMNLMVGLQTTLEMMKQAGLESIFTRHQRLMQATRAGIKALNLPLFADDSCASPAITAVAPQKISADAIRTLMHKRFDIALAGGQNHLTGKILRIGHLGFVSDRDILCCIASLEGVLQELGWEGFTPGTGVVAVNKNLS
ncbi:MAG: alanine--glyoxylate aminotransferase family protein [Nostocaceae cyanobacterium]|nr:alanine--glyoxylate aminotransferase family protein [Nostocaceae cyanobacterium]